MNDFLWMMISTKILNDPKKIGEKMTDWSWTKICYQHILPCITRKTKSHPLRGHHQRAYPQNPDFLTPLCPLGRHCFYKVCFTLTPLTPHPPWPGSSFLDGSLYKTIRFFKPPPSFCLNFIHFWQTTSPWGVHTYSMDDPILGLVLDFRFPSALFFIWKFIYFVSA